jgi:hypothetical protein
MALGALCGAKLLLVKGWPCLGGALLLNVWPFGPWLGFALKWLALLMAPLAGCSNLGSSQLLALCARRFAPASTALRFAPLYLILRSYVHYVHMSLRNYRYALVLLTRVARYYSALLRIAAHIHYVHICSSLYRFALSLLCRCAPVLEYRSEAYKLACS